MAEAKPNILQRLLAVRKTVGYVQKDQKKIDGKYTATMYDDVVQATRQAMCDNGIMHVVNVKDGWTVEAATTKSGGDLTRLQCTIVTTFYNVDDPADKVECSCPAFGLDAGDKGPGKARTYGAKGNLLTALFLLTGDDEESRVENVPGVTKEAPPPPPPILSNEEIRAALDKVTFAGSKKELDGIYTDLAAVVKSRKGKQSDPGLKEVIAAASKRAGVIAEAVKKEADAERDAIQKEGEPVK